MSIRFGWTRPQAGPESTDDEQVEDMSSAPPEVDAATRAPVLRSARICDVTRSSNESPSALSSAVPVRAAWALRA